jgi:hypothetical protein
MDTACLGISIVTGTSPGGGSTLLIVVVPALPLSVIGAVDYEELNYMRTRMRRKGDEFRNEVAQPGLDRHPE